MPRKALIIKAKKVPKFSTRKQNRCMECGRSGGVLKFALCRMCLRIKYFYAGRIPGWRKS